MPTSKEIENQCSLGHFHQILFKCRYKSGAITQNTKCQHKILCLWLKISGYGEMPYATNLCAQTHVETCVSYCNCTLIVILVTTQTFD